MFVEFYIFCGGKSRLAADFVADLTDELGVGCGCCGGVRWVAGVGETGFLWGFGVFGEYWGEKPGFWVGGWDAVSVQLDDVAIDFRL